MALLWAFSHIVICLIQGRHLHSQVFTQVKEELHATADMTNFLLL